MLNIEAGGGLLRAPSNPLPFGDCAPGPPRRCAVADRRSIMVAARVTPEEHAAWQAKAEAAGVSPSRLLRQAMARTRTWTAPAAEVERERTRQIARVGNNLNQIARWANTHASPMDAVEMIAYLLHIARTLDKLARVGREADGAR